MSLILALRHVSLLVADLPRAREFYEGVLGLTPNLNRAEMSFTGIWYDIADTQIHLMCLPNPEQGLSRPANGGRDRHTAFSVADIALLQTRLTRLNINYTMSQSGRIALFCRDPDDNALEFIG